MAVSQEDFTSCLRLKKRQRKNRHFFLENRRLKEIFTTGQRKKLFVWRHSVQNLYLDCANSIAFHFWMLHECFVCGNLFSVQNMKNFFVLKLEYYEKIVSQKNKTPAHIFRTKLLQQKHDLQRLERKQ